MSSILPQGKLAPIRVNPKILMLYALPKVGKTKVLSELDNTLILDLEGGAEMYECSRMKITSTMQSKDKGLKLIPGNENSGYSIDEVITSIIETGKQNGGKFPFNYIALDTIDKLEDFAEISATRKYKQSVIGKTFQGNSILELPQGGGYYYLREEVKLYIEKLSRVCKNLILVSHVKEKLLNKAGVEVTSRDISLSGKLSQIVCSMADAIGYMSRDTTNNGKLMINFQTFDNAIMGARCPHLAGKQFEFDWSKLYIEENLKTT